MDQLTEQLQVLQHAFQTGSLSVMCAASGMTSSSWILDSGATHHMTSDATQLVDLRPTHLTSQVRTADGTLLSVSQLVVLPLHLALLLPLSFLKFIMFLVLPLALFSLVSLLTLD